MTVDALHAHANAVLEAGDPATAEDLLVQARADARTSEEIAAVDGTLAVAEAEQGRTDDALARCSAALDLPDLSDTARALLTAQLGVVRWINGDSHDAIALFSGALPHLADDLRMSILLNRGTASLTVGDLASARDDFVAGLGSDDETLRARFEHGLGYVHLLRGEVVDALRLMDRASQVLANHGPAAAAVAATDRCEALEAAGLGREAVGVLRQLTQDLADSGLWRLQAEVELRLARLVRLPEAIALANSATARNVEHDNEIAADGCRAVELDLLARGALPPRPEKLDEVAVRLAEAGRTEDARALSIRAAGLRGTMPEPVDGSAPLTIRLLAGEVGAEVALAKGDATEALRRAGEAVDELEEWQRSIGSLELQSSTITLGGEVIRLGQRAALASGDPAALLEWSERAREVASRGVPSRPPEELGDLLAQLRHLGPDGDPAKRADLIERIRHGRWHATGSIEAAHTLTLDQLQTALGSARFVSILDIDDHVIALSVKAYHVQVHDLGPWKELDAQLGGLPADLSLAAQSTMSLVRRSLAERLATIDTILAPALTGARDVVLTVPDKLAHIPWGQLESLRGTAVTLPVSATAWVKTVRHVATSPRSVGVVVGPGTHTGTEEARAVAGAWAETAETTVLAKATCDQVRDLAGRVDVLHISAHGRDRDGHRLFAATELADGEWFGHDVELLPHVPDIVVLSACSVGGGSLGMTRAWLHAGARHVIASPADISETAAAERFPRLHALLADGITPERAVAEAFGPDALDCTVQSYGPPPLG